MLPAWQHDQVADVSSSFLEQCLDYGDHRDGSIESFQRGLEDAEAFS